MADPIHLASLSDPRTLAPTGARVQAGTGIDTDPNLLQLSRNVAPALNGATTGFTQNIMHGMMERIASDIAGVRISLPTEAERANAAVLAQIQGKEATKKNSILNVQLARATLIDLDSKQKELLGLPTTGDPFDTDPDVAIAAARQLGINVSAGDLSLAGAEFTDSASAKAAAETASREEAQDKLSGQVGAAADIEKLAKVHSEAGKERGPLGAFLADSRSRIEGQSGENLGTGLGSDIDTFSGSRAFFRLTEDATEAGGQFFDMPVVVDAFLAKHGANLKDQMEGLRTDERGALMVGHGDSGVDDEATLYLVASMLKLAEKKYGSAANIGDIFADVGLSYSGVDGDSFLLSVLDVAEKQGDDPLEFLEALGFTPNDNARSFLEAAASGQRN